jgi:hypothetical protein
MRNMLLRGVCSAPRLGVFDAPSGSLRLVPILAQRARALEATIAGSARYVSVSPGTVLLMYLP